MQIQMRINAACQQQTRSIAIEITDRYRILSCIAPEELLRLKAYSQGIGPAKILAYNHTRIGTIHAGFANVRIVSPVGPVNVTLIRIQGNATRLPQILIDEHLAIFSIQLRHLNRVQSLVAPIQILGHPIHCKSIGIL